MTFGNDIEVLAGCALAKMSRLMEDIVYFDITNDNNFYILAYILSLSIAAKNRKFQVISVVSHSKCPTCGSVWQ